MSNPVTPSEELLARLGRHAFLSLWSYPNLFTDRGRKFGRGHGKELCDLLVVFGDTLIIFSDKHCILRREPDELIQWKRWYKHAIQKSVDQVVGAERWILQHPDRIYLDRACSRRFELEVATAPTVHRILTCRGASEESRTRWGGTGSLFVTNGLIADCTEVPHRLGAFDGNGRMFHVFDEVAIEALLSTIDTVADFTAYRRKREHFFGRDLQIVAAGEEDLLAFYLLTDLDNEDATRSFLVPADRSAIFIDESHWQYWLVSPQRAAWEAANEVSYAWDALTEKFSYHVVSGTQYFAEPRGLPEQEIVLRWMAREDRVRRRMLARSLLEMIKTTPTGQIRRRYLPPSSRGDPYWVFLVAPNPGGLEEREYRETRRAMLLGHLLVVKYLHQDAMNLVGIAVDGDIPEITEDAIYLDGREWTEEMAQQAKQLHIEEGNFRNPRQIAWTDWDYPIE